MSPCLSYACDPDSESRTSPCLVFANRRGLPIGLGMESPGHVFRILAIVGRAARHRAHLPRPKAPQPAITSLGQGRQRRTSASAERSHSRAKNRKKSNHLDPKP